LVAKWRELASTTVDDGSCRFAQLLQQAKSLEIVGAINMASSTQRKAAKKNISKAATAAKKKRTIAHLPKSVRTALGEKGAIAARK
jgi:hypothetical protein